MECIERLLRQYDTYGIVAIACYIKENAGTAKKSARRSVLRDFKRYLKPCEHYQVYVVKNNAEAKAAKKPTNEDFFVKNDQTPVATRSQTSSVSETRPLVDAGDCSEPNRKRMKLGTIAEYGTALPKAFAL